VKKKYSSFILASSFFLCVNNISERRLRCVSFDKFQLKYQLKTLFNT